MNKIDISVIVCGEFIAITYLCKFNIDDRHAKTLLTYEFTKEENMFQLISSKILRNIEV